MGLSVRQSVLAVLAAASLMGGCAHLDAQVADGGTAVVASQEYENLPPVVVEANQNAERRASAEPAVYRTGDEGPYTLDTGDRLRVFVYGQPNLSRLYTVDQAGRISVPLIGNVMARGKSTTELEAVIRRRLGAEFVKDPQVTVDVQQNRPFFILGEVRNPGQFPFVSGMTVQTAVAIGGGYSERASERSVRITRTHDGVAEDFEAPTNFVLMPGDTVYVQERFF